MKRSIFYAFAPRLAVAEGDLKLIVNGDTIELADYVDDQDDELIAESATTPEARLLHLSARIAPARGEHRSPFGSNDIEYLQARGNHYLYQRFFFELNAMKNGALTTRSIPASLAIAMWDNADSKRA